MKQGCVGENAVETGLRKVEREKILLQHLAPGHVPRHADHFRRALDSDRFVAEPAEIGQIAPRAATEIENNVWRRPFQFIKQGGAVLIHVVILGALPE